MHDRKKPGNAVTKSHKRFNILILFSVELSDSYSVKCNSCEDILFAGNCAFISKKIYNMRAIAS